MITYEEVKDLVNGKLIDKTNLTPYEDLSERLFGEGNCFNESEVRKRLYGMTRLIGSCLFLIYMFLLTYRLTMVMLMPVK